jgi:hypothetical protein
LKGSEDHSEKIVKGTPRQGVTSPSPLAREKLEKFLKRGGKKKK